MNSNERKSINLNDLNMAYYEKGQGEALIILHGNSMNSLLMDKLFDHCSKQYHVYALDSRGHGYSDIGNEKYTTKLMAEDVIKFCEEKKLSKVKIIGFSDGGNTGLMTSILKPDLVTGLTAISANCTKEGLDENNNIVKLLKFLAKVSKPFRNINNSMKDFNWKMELASSDPGITAKDLASIKAPVLILSAEHDIIKYQHTLEIAKHIKNSSMFVIPNCSHLSIYHQDELIRTIDEAKSSGIFANIDHHATVQKSNNISSYNMMRNPQNKYNEIKPSYVNSQIREKANILKPVDNSKKNFDSKLLMKKTTKDVVGKCI